MKNTFIYDKVNDIIFKELEKGNVPWKKPWITKFPANLISKKEYQGFNWWMLMITQEIEHYQSHYWLTFNQVVNLKGKVKKGAKSTPVIYWKILEIKTGKLDKKGKEKIDKVPLLKYYNVFNIDQTEGIKVEAIAKEEVFNKTAEQIIKHYKLQIQIKSGGSQAYYSPKEDYINIPDRNTFPKDDEFYATNFHEMTHSTGHEKRLNRFKLDDDIDAVFGSQSYSKEELVAEMGSAYLCAKTKLLPTTLKNKTAYIQSWLKALKDDRTLLVSASGKAQKAVDYILT